MDTEAERIYNEWLKQLGRFVASRRNALEHTQAEAASRCGLDLKFYQDVEYGRRPVTTRTLFAVARGLNTSVKNLIPDWPAPSEEFAVLIAAEPAPEYRKKGE